MHACMHAHKHNNKQMKEVKKKNPCMTCSSGSRSCFASFSTLKAYIHSGKEDLQICVRALLRERHNFSNNIKVKHERGAVDIVVTQGSKRIKKYNIVKS